MSRKCCLNYVEWKKESMNGYQSKNTVRTTSIQNRKSYNKEYAYYITMICQRNRKYCRGLPLLIAGITLRPTAYYETSTKLQEGDMDGG